MTGWLVSLGVAVFGYALRTFSQPVLRKTGAVLYLAASWLMGLEVTGSHFGGLAAVLLWFLLPWVEIVLRVRKMRLPLRKTLRHRLPPNREEFPHLAQLTEEIEREGFEQTDDTGFDWEELRQFMRLFYHAPSRTQATIHLHQQGNMSVAFVSVTTRTLSGRTLTSSNYPFSQTMKQAPGFTVHREPMVESFAELLTEHRAMLAAESIGEADIADPGVEELAKRLESDIQAQVEHNLKSGVIHESGEGVFRYTWRGCFYLWRQLVKDMVRYA